MTPLVDIQNLSKSFPGVKALDGVRFDLMPGEVHALMGENGAGKSTLMKILAGVYRKDSGQMMLDGKAVEIDSPAHAQALAIGIIHQELHLMGHLTAAQNIYLGREPRRMAGLFLDEEQLNRDAQALFDRMHLALAPTTPIGELTVARQQMVEIAKALSHKSRVLIMDEPTAALNNAEIDDLFRIIRQLKSEGVGIVYISHKMDEIQRIADRITVMRDGAYIATVPATTPMPEVIAMMVGRKLEQAEKTIPDTSANEVLLDVRGLNRGRAIRDVSFTVRRGEILGFAGLMGAGRTEVARAVFGADPIESGEVHVRGQHIRLTSPQDAVQAGIGYLSEDRKHFGLATGMDVESNITLPSLKRWLKWGIFLNQPAIRTISQQMVEKLRIKTPSLTQTAKLLSGGNQQKVVIAKWLVQDCEVLIFDEPTRGIDVGAKSEIYKLLNELAAQGRAIIVISSELPEVLQLSHRVLVMCEGRITGEVRGDEATQENLMALATQREAEAPAAVH
ncbi:sugar ABC transporter ATP-binding protein [Rhodoferax saidenbachensis]|uniref:D-xylose ABC transporter ATP-binding protein n=1 Tax=Rhodoferax saidenbachensis TaxID=1484693 RepID=A0A1P8KAC9_9BURK|nr:sugar ABC transporter ATP-binding protein [Rhodoferax saidenbachensis]APW42961.1 D-xylose ABC transporter ATP-binding protein [Rhodoferax saidenbachensis]